MSHLLVISLQFDGMFLSVLSVSVLFINSRWIPAHDGDIQEVVIHVSSEAVHETDIDQYGFPIPQKSDELNLDLPNTDRTLPESDQPATIDPSDGNTTFKPDSATEVENEDNFGNDNIADDPTTARDTNNLEDNDVNNGTNDRPNEPAPSGKTGVVDEDPANEEPTSEPTPIQNDKNDFKEDAPSDKAIDNENVDNGDNVDKDTVDNTVDTNRSNVDNNNVHEKESARTNNENGPETKEPENNDPN